MKQETDVLKSYLKAAQKDISGLLEEKRTLLDTVQTLQVNIFFLQIFIIFINYLYLFFF